jgi:NAD(P)-dependent dehydrogenase (short-subunit alcohol dehydrogenase family)
MTDPNTYQAPPGLLDGRVILITGSSRGIGHTCALACAAHGATVVLHGRHAPTLETAYDEIVARGYPEPAAVPLDLDKAGTREYDHLAYVIESQLGRLDGIIHNASHLEKLSGLEHQSIDEWTRTLRVNLIAPFALTQACARLLRASPDASKSALETMARIQADEWSRNANLRCNIVVPGPVNSPSRGKTHPGEAPGALRSPQALMPLYLYLIGPASRGTSGAVFRAQA